MNAVRTVPVDAAVRLTVTARLQHLCPFVNEVDNGGATIGWDADGWTFELHALRAYLSSFSDREISHEELTQELQHELAGHHGINNVAVETHWDTAGMGVSCSTSPIPAARP